MDRGKFGLRLTLLLPLLVFSLFLGKGFAADEELKFIDGKADALVFINNDPEDAGLSFVMDLWKGRFDIKETTEKREAIEKVYSELPFGKITGAAFLPREAFNAEKEPIYPDFIIAIEITGEPQVFAETLEILITKRKALKKTTYEGYHIVYRDKALEPYHGEKDLAAYVQVNKKKLAIKDYQKVLMLDPANEEATQSLSAIKSNQ